ncbi:MAG TPA: hypothetical protein VFH61_09945 [Thermoleophilia bacterium]|nr:hypothetical protein [Thermoleophilia bacterium]
MSTRITAIRTGRRARSYAAGRVCAHPFCKTVLSVYNSGALCGMHEGESPTTPDEILFPPYQCPTCQRIKPRNGENFHVDRAMEDGLTRECADCRNRSDRSEQARAKRTRRLRRKRERTA